MDEPNLNQFSATPISSPNNMSQPDVNDSTADDQKITSLKVVGSIFIGLLVIGFILPANDHNSLLSLPIIFFGTIAGILFLTKCIALGRKSRNILLTIFLVLCGIGVGFVIFIVSLLGALFTVANGTKGS